MFKTSIPQLVIKPKLLDGLLLYSGQNDFGDFISLHLNFGNFFPFFNPPVNLNSTWSLSRTFPPLTDCIIARIFRICRVQFWFGQRINECQITISDFTGRVAYHKGVENSEACSFERFQLFAREMRLKVNIPLIFNFNLQSTLNPKPWMFHQTDFGIFHCLIHYFWVSEKQRKFLSDSYV